MSSETLNTAGAFSQAKDLKNRIILHNSSKGAKFTKGNKWFLIYKKSYSSKNIAMKEEYKLKKNYLLRNKIKKEFINDVKIQKNKE